MEIKNISPILNNPYDEPKWHYDTTLEGNLDYSKSWREEDRMRQI